MSLEENLNKYKNKANEGIIADLIDCLKEENINDVNQLSILEDKIFTFNGKVLDTKQRIEYCSFDIKKAYYDYDGLSLNQMLLLKSLKESLDTDISYDEKILNIIKINFITNREIMFVNKAYEYIVKGLL